MTQIQTHIPPVNLGRKRSRRIIFPVGRFRWIAAGKPPRFIPVWRGREVRR